MSEDQPTPAFEPSPPSQSRTGLWIALIGVAVCLILAIIVAAIGGLGWIAYNGIQSDNAAATTQAQNDGATATAHAQIVLPPPGWSLTLDEQFTSNQYDWDVGSYKGDDGDGVLSIENRCYQWQIEAKSKDGFGWWEIPVLDHRLGDFYVSVDCRQISGDIAGSDYGLVFRFINRDNYFYYVIADDQLMRIGLRKKGEWFDLLPWERASPIRPGEVNQVAVLAEGTRYRFFVNDELVYDMDDDRLFGGRIGLIVDISGKSRAEFQFDNLQIYEP